MGMPMAGVICTGGLGEFLASCKNKTAPKDEGTTHSQHPRRPKKTPVQRGNPYAGRDEMFLHNKSKTLHYPFVFKTYDKLKEDRVTSVNPGDWAAQLDNGAHFAKEGSALIFERLALKNLSAGINNESLGSSSAIFTRSFKTDYAKQNVYNWRGYYLLLQMIALNSAVPDTDKWSVFSNAIREANVAGIKKMPKRNEWITSQALFDQRVQYIHQHSDDYMNRIKKRMA